MESHFQKATDLLTESEVAELLRVSTRTLQNWRVRGGGPTFLKVGSRVLYSSDGLVSFLQGCHRVSTSDTGSQDPQDGLGR